MAVFRIPNDSPNSNLRVTNTKLVQEKLYVGNPWPHRRIPCMREHNVFDSSKFEYFAICKFALATVSLSPGIRPGSRGATSR